MKKGKEKELGRKWGATGLGGLLSTLPRQHPSIHARDPPHPCQCAQACFLSTACIISIYFPVIREVPICFIV